MIIQAIDCNKNLFRVEHIIPETLVREMLSIDWMLEPWRRQECQEHWLRRKIDTNKTVQKIDGFLRNELVNINKVCGTTFENCHTIVWLDEPGFSVGIHEDNPGVVGSMQLYWSFNDLGLGTTFFINASSEQVRYRCPYMINSGYLMINGPGQFHGMTQLVPEGTYRLSTYTYFD